MNSDIKIRTEIADGKKVQIFDNVVDEEFINDFADLLDTLQYARNEKSRNDDAYPIFNAEFIPEKFDSQTLGKVSRELVEKYVETEAKVLNRSYINLITYGDMEYPHRDCLVGQKDLTVLYYANSTWKLEWGGETLFYEGGEAKFAVSPRPGRFVIFDGDIEHCGGVPTRVCPASRYTLAMKYMIKAI